MALLKKLIPFSFPQSGRGLWCDTVEHTPLFLASGPHNALAEYETKNKQSNEYIEQDFGNAIGHICDKAKAEEACYNCQYQKCYCPFNHRDVLLKLRLFNIKQILVHDK